MTFQVTQEFISLCSLASIAQHHIQLDSGRLSRDGTSREQPRNPMHIQQPPVLDCGVLAKYAISSPNTNMVRWHRLLSSSTASPEGKGGADGRSTTQRRGRKRRRKGKNGNNNSRYHLFNGGAQSSFIPLRWGYTFLGFNHHVRADGSLGSITNRLALLTGRMLLNHRLYLVCGGH